MNMAIKAIIIVIVLAFVWFFYQQQNSMPNLPNVYDLLENNITRPEKIHLSEDEWRKKLTPDQFHVLRENGTEPPYSGVLLNEKEQGVYLCAACALPLFSSNDKYDSGTGWPSFTQPINPLNVLYTSNNSLFFKQIEVSCARCDSHLGDVFQDGPPPTDLRYCINSLALVFEQKKQATSDRKN